MVVLRSLIFTILFFVLTAILCVGYVILSYFISRKKLISAIRFYMHMLHWMERNVLNLDYEVRGIENLPKDNRFILAAKHQSTYETMKLHLLFDDPSIVLKKELTEIPLWGHLAKKVDVIAIDRSSREKAMQTIREETKRVITQNRPIVIFPQGTRVSINHSTKDKPYKFGIARIYKETNIPVIPMALNTGYFWPRLNLLKKPGRVIFEFLPPIQPGLSQSDFMAKLENDMETASQKLVDEAKSSEH